ncbi:hypothetical protein COLO4_06554 [Corchorus olitorius]|uniref:Uncharacterized protein n=1 Tax=Corchorus olitorius TaxID=93759 RepID=A0A1R3KMN8_9ROSI|nr:hypothetical protein COLO4_06554 [Corchorus olitorius]
MTNAQRSSSLTLTEHDPHHHAINVIHFQPRKRSNI